MIKKFVKVIDGQSSNANNYKYKINKVNIANKWNPNSDTPSEFGGFNFTTEEKVLRWLHRGDTIYDVIIPNDAETILVDEEKGIYRTNKIIIANPKKITDEMVINFYQINTLPPKSIYQCLITLLWKNRENISKYIIKDYITLNNINDAISEIDNYYGIDKLLNTFKDIYETLIEIQSNLDICLYIDKKPYVKKISNDKVINLAGQSGSGKSTYAKTNFNDKEKYIIIDTDEIFSDKRFKKSTGYNKKLGEYFRSKYKDLPTTGENFDLIYQEIINFFKYSSKTIVIDCAQFHCIKDLNILKGEIIIIRTAIDKCYNRCVDRYINNNSIYTPEELAKYKEKKKSIYKWYKYTNKFIHAIDDIK